ncbi:MAG: DJ-1/PfpI family protein [Gammaproteobacteria bacterium]
MAHSVLVPIADGIEEIETINIVDVLRRANITVTLASIKPNGEKQITAAHGLMLTADTHFDNIATQHFDCIALPGGLPGAANLRDYPPLIQKLKAQLNQNDWIAAICAAPALVLATHGLLANKAATCYPGCEDQLPDTSRAQEAVVIDGNCITAQGPAKAFNDIVIFQLAGNRKPSSR